MKDDNTWYQTAIIYEVQLRSFFDSDGDGIGDFQGLTQKLDYFEHLGVTALWLLPFYPSPLRDDGYDIADYYSVHPSYGTLDDFKTFLAAAHERGLRVITELVLNHTSDLNPWFQTARRAEPGSPERDFYVWSDTSQKYSDVRIIFRDFEMSNWTWDPIAKAYFWHRFYSHQPDLNYDNPKVCETMLGVIDYWLEMGVDGLRLDAVPYLFEREGTSCENLPETHAFLRRIREHVDSKFPGRMLLAEANQWPEDAVAYFGKGDECHMAFHFPLMPRLFMGVQMEDRFPVLDILDQTPAIPESCQWAIFLRNHDELTLEMVTDEERDYMYRIYAEDPRARINLGIRRRLAPLLGNNRRKIELLNSLLLSLPGTPIIYYGDELGMGDNFYLGDRNGVRTPMQWSADRNAGFSRANPQQLYLPVIIDPEYHYETVNVENQVRNPSSLFWWMRRILSIRKRWRAFALGNLSFLECENAKVLAFVREYDDETILVVANLSRFAQSALVDLSAYAGRVPEELFGHSRFPELTEAAAPFILGPHGFYWFALRKAVVAESTEDWQAPEIELDPKMTASLCRRLEADILPRYLHYCRWFGGKERTQRDLRIIEKVALDPEDSGAWLILFEVSFVEGDPQTYALPVAFVDEGTVDLPPVAILARLEDELLCDALYLPKFREDLFQWTTEGRSVPEGGSVRLQGSPAEGLDFGGEFVSRLVPTEQSNTSIIYGEQWFLKFIRRLEEGINPEAMILQHLEKQAFAACPSYAGELSLLFEGRRRTAALLTGYVKNQGDGWEYTVDELARFMERVISSGEEPGDAESVDSAMGAVYTEKAERIGMRLGELHRALVISDGDPYFEPEPFTGFYQRSLYQTMRTATGRSIRSLLRSKEDLTKESRELAEDWIDLRSKALETHAILLGKRFDAVKMRVHGDFHLGQILNTGKDFVIMDFEGEPRRPLGERLLKRSPMVDLAGMLRSFDYAMEAATRHQSSQDLEALRPWTRLWAGEISKAFLAGYFETLGDARLHPRDPEEFAMLLKVFLLEKATYEIGYELAFRPAEVSIPLRAAIRLILEDGPAVSMPDL